MSRVKLAGEALAVQVGEAGQAEQATEVGQPEQKDKVGQLGQSPGSGSAVEEG